MKKISSVGDLSSRLISDNFFDNFETSWLFSILQDDCDIDEGPFARSSILIFQDKNEMCW